MTNEVKQPGRYHVQTDLRDSGTGIYFYSIASDDLMTTRELVMGK